MSEKPIINDNGTAYDGRRGPLIVAAVTVVVFVLIALGQLL